MNATEYAPRSDASDRWQWFNASRNRCINTDPDDLPGELFARLKKGIPCGEGFREYRTEAEALADLVQALRSDTEPRSVAPEGFTFYDPGTGDKHELSESAVAFLKLIWGVE